MFPLFLLSVKELGSSDKDIATDAMSERRTKRRPKSARSTRPIASRRAGPRCLDAPSHPRPRRLDVIPRRRRRAIPPRPTRTRAPRVRTRRRRRAIIPPPRAGARCVLCVCSCHAPGPAGGRRRVRTSGRLVFKRDCVMMSVPLQLAHAQLAHAHAQAHLVAAHAQASEMCCFYTPPNGWRHFTLGSQ